MPRTAILYIEERCNQSCVFDLKYDSTSMAVGLYRLLPAPHDIE